MGKQFDAPTRIRSMWIAQVVSGIIYVAFFLLLSPLLDQLAKGSGVATIITVSATVSVLLPVSLTIAAGASQFSASVANSAGNQGLIGQLSGGKIDGRHACVLIAMVGIAILLTLNVDSVIALASRAFAFFYAIQCFEAWCVARHRAEDKAKSGMFLGLAIVSAAVGIFGVPS